MFPWSNELGQTIPLICEELATAEAWQFMEGSVLTRKNYLTPFPNTKSEITLLQTKLLKIDHSRNLKIPQIISQISNCF